MILAAPNQDYPMIYPYRIIKGARVLLLIGVLVFIASAVVYADERLQDWIPPAIGLPDDAEVVTERAIGSTVRMFSITTSADVEALFLAWETALTEAGLPITRGTEDLETRSIEFSGPGIANAKIIEAPNTSDGRSLIEFDATLD